MRLYRVSETSSNDALRDVFTIQGVTDTVPRNADGGIDWYYRGPRDDHEYALLFNRHGYFEALLRSWRASGDSRYSKGFDRLVRDWIIRNPPPGEGTREPNWRFLEVGRRWLGVLSTAWHGIHSFPASSAAVIFY